MIYSFKFFFLSLAAFLKDSCLIVIFVNSVFFEYCVDKNNFFHNMLEGLMYFRLTHVK